MNTAPMKTRYAVKIDLLILETAFCSDLAKSNKHIASKFSFVVHEDNWCRIRGKCALRSYYLINFDTPEELRKVAEIAVT